MAWKKDETNRGSEVLGLGGVKPDRERAPQGLARDERESVGTAGEVERVSATGSLKPSKGATGIDMGAGGEGTDIEP